MWFSIGAFGVGRLAYWGPVAARLLLAAGLVAPFSQASASDRQVLKVLSADATPIVFECGGSGPEVLIVHGGTGDRTRWTPMFAYLERDFTVCAMDRRAHGQSGDGPDYSLRKEAQDIVAVVGSRKAPVAVVGHSFGAVAAYEAAHLTPLISKLVLYEPPLRLSDHAAVLAKMETLIQSGDRDAATVAFMRDIVQLAPSELSAMQARPTWKMLVASIDTSIRQDRVLSSNPWSASRARSLQIPTLLMIGGLTKNPELLLSIQSLAETLPANQLVVLDGQEHNAMDTDRERLASLIRIFLTQR